MIQQLSLKPMWICRNIFPEITSHAWGRMAERNISREVVVDILEFGTCQWKDGSYRCTVTMSDLPKAKRKDFEKYKRAIVVISPNLEAIKTVEWDRLVA